jgi:hypothetical protein
VVAILGGLTQREFREFGAAAESTSDAEDSAAVTQAAAGKVAAG